LYTYPVGNGGHPGGGLTYISSLKLAFKNAFVKSTPDTFRFNNTYNANVNLTVVVLATGA
jgi:hypothetical protein